MVLCDVAIEKVFIVVNFDFIVIAGFVCLYKYLLIFVDLLDVLSQFVLQFVSDGSFLELQVGDHVSQLVLKLLQLFDVGWSGLGWEPKGLLL